MKKTLYPKTKRIGRKGATYTLTEKLDGSNLGFFRQDDDLIIAQRNYIFKLSELDEIKDKLYKGLYQWLKDNGEVLVNALRPNSGMFGEWIGMGKLKYPNLEHRFYMFAKANLERDFTIKNLYYDRELFIYPFENEEIPEFIKVVPVVMTFNFRPTIEEIDEAYADYRKKQDRDIEGFVIYDGNAIQKYVRMKNGTLEEHKS